MTFKNKPTKNDIKKPICRVTERMKVGKKEANNGKEPAEKEVTLLRDIKSCRTWIEINGKKDHLYKIYIDGILDSRWHHHNGQWLKAIRAPEGMREMLTKEDV